MFNIKVNGSDYPVDATADTPLLWVIRDSVGLTGTKYGCGAGLCGACSVHVNGELMRSCQVSIKDVDGAEVTTIEGLGAGRLTKIQEAWIAEGVPQCGYCQSGQIMAAESLVARIPNPSDAEIEEAMTNICRCGTYDRIKKAIRRAAA